MNHYTHELRAKALEIAIGLTGADHTWLRTDDRGFVIINEPLLSTWKTVHRAIYAVNDLDTKGEILVFPEASNNCLNK